MNPRGESNIEQIADAVLRSVAEPLRLAGVEVAIKPSIGIAVYPEHGTSGKQLIANADAAMYRAKRLGLGVMFFEPP